MLDCFDGRFGYFLLHAYDLKKIFYGLGSGLRQNLDWQDFKALLCLLPPLPEQVAIVRFLDYVERRIRRYIRAKQKLIKLLEEQKQAIIHRAVTRGLDPNVRLKPSGIDWLGNVPSHWQIWKISHLAKVGNGSTPSRSNAAYWLDGAHPWLNSSCVNQGRIRNADQYVTDLALRECHLHRVSPGSVLVAITGQGKTRGTAAILDIEATINQHIAYITLQKDIVHSEYLRMFLVGMYMQLRAISADSGSTRGALTCEDLKRFPIVIPPREEQPQIIAALHDSLSEIEITSARIEREIALLREYRTRLIADIVTGKLDVRGVELPEVDKVEAQEDWDQDADAEAEEIADVEETVDADE
jgi:type I restriction enzyme S subunit